VPATAARGVDSCRQAVRFFQYAVSLFAMRSVFGCKARLQKAQQKKANVRASQRSRNLNFKDPFGLRRVVTLSLTVIK